MKQDLLYIPNRTDAQLLPPRLDARDPTDFSMLPGFFMGAGGLENTIFSQSQRKSHPKPAAHKPPYFISCDPDYCIPIYKLPGLPDDWLAKAKEPFWNQYFGSEKIPGYGLPDKYLGMVPPRDKERFGNDSIYTGALAMGSVPAGIAVVKVPAYVLGENVLGRAFLYQNYIQIRDDLHGNDYEEVLLHELLHVYFPEKNEREIRSMTKGRLPFAARFH